ncbi:MAG: sodium:alanine symporter family protein [Lachnospiraceae bacterium]|nr:sodium:alanine symporter family protein [Lachnospiraceae bacterium]
MPAFLSHAIDWLNRLLWNGPLLILLCATHLLFTIRLGFPQKNTFRAIKLSVAPEAAEKNSKNLSGFATLATTLAATLGTGNIVGVSTAIAAGGPGALFWCWITGILGMATAYAECFLSVHFRHRRSDGSYTGGPMYVLEKGLGSPKLGKLYACCTLLAAFGVGCTTQSSAIADALTTLWKIPPQLTGALIALIAGAVILGGIHSISRFCTRIVPLMGGLYIAACLLLLFQNAAFLPKSIGVILQTAFAPRAVSGGLLGGSFLMAARYGIARGLFTNEAGIGTAAIAAGSTRNASPTRQGLISMTAVFWDTVVMCALTGLVIVSNLLRFPGSARGFSEAGLTGAAFLSFPFGGNTFLTLLLIAFAITTLIGWCYLGEKGAEYLFYTKGTCFYHVIYIIMIYIGAILPMEYVWGITDLINGFMVLPNILTLWCLKSMIEPPFRHKNTSPKKR